GKGSQGKKTGNTHMADFDVSEEFDSEPTRKRTAGKRVVKKNVTIFAANNIIPDPDVTLELGKSISLTEATEKEATRQVLFTHVRITTESEPEPDKKKTGSKKLEATYIMQALKESKKTSKRQPGTKGSSEETIVSPGVPDESTVILATLSDGTGTKLGVLDGKRLHLKKMLFLSGDFNKKVNILKKIKFVHGDEQVNDDEDEEMSNAKVKDSGKISIVKDTTNVEIKSLLDIKIKYEVLHIQSPFVLRVAGHRDHLPLAATPPLLHHTHHTVNTTIILSSPPWPPLQLNCHHLYIITTTTTFTATTTTTITIKGASGSSQSPRKGKDYAQTVKNQSKPGNIEHKI
nr:hypothetical protein [Tanacetum cinerariifolium]